MSVAFTLRRFEKDLILGVTPSRDSFEYCVGAVIETEALADEATCELAHARGLRSWSPVAKLGLKHKVFVGEVS